MLRIGIISLRKVLVSKALDHEEFCQGNCESFNQIHWI